MGVFERCNLAVWPAQLLFYAAAAGVLVLVARPRGHAGRWVGAVLAFFWAWSTTGRSSPASTAFPGSVAR